MSGQAWRDSEGAVLTIALVVAAALVLVIGGALMLDFVGGLAEGLRAATVAPSGG